MRKFAIGMGAIILLTAFGDPVYFNLKEGNELYNEEKYPESLEQYRNAQNGDPESKATSYNVGNALYKLGRYGEAAKAYRKAMKSGDATMKKAAGYNRGTALLKGGEQAQKEMKPDVAEPMLKESVKQLTEVALNYPDNEDARHNLELAIEMLKDLEKQKQKQKQEKQGEDQKEGENSQSQPKNSDKKKNEDKQDKAQPDKSGEDKEKEDGDKKEASRQDGEMTPEKARQIMDAVERDEAELREKLHAGSPEDNAKHEKDW